jgi:tetratricopeptide (TPR) repeat protein
MAARTRSAGGHGPPLPLASIGPIDTVGAMPQPRKPATASHDPFAALPDPARAAGVDDLAEQLRRLKIWAGDPSYETIKDRVNATWTAAGRPADSLVGKTTVVDCFRPRRRRLNTDLVAAVVQALHPDTGYVTQWRQALRVVGGEIEAAAQVRVQATLPDDLVGFTGRTDELRRLRRTLHDGLRAGSPVVISAIAGMAGVGKTQLAVHAGHLLHAELPFEQMLFVNLRGFHPDPAQPPADPAAVLDGFLRLLGVPGQQIPHGLAARAAAFRTRLAGVRALVVLDNAATADQVRPLLPATPGCLTLVTSRRSLTDLDPATHVAVEVFTPDEASAFLAGAVPASVPAGLDPDAAARIARRCGYLPLALSLVAGHIRGTPGWTLTDHADRLDERHAHRRLDSAVELALDLSYQHLPAAQRRLLRLASLHPGQDVDAYAAAALAGSDPVTARADLDSLGADHLLQVSGPGRYTFHDLVRAYATTRSHDEDRPAERRAALTRLFDHYLATTAAAMDAVHPAEAHLRPEIAPAATAGPDLTDPDIALNWLDNERLTLVTVAGHTVAHGWPDHTVRLARLLFRYLTGGHFTDALIVHGHALQAARDGDDRTAQRYALNNLGAACMGLGRHEQAAQHLQQAVDLFRRADDPDGQARALGNLGIVEQRLTRYPAATGHFAQARALFQQAGNPAGEARTLNNLGILATLQSDHDAAADHCRQALELYRRIGDQTGEAHALNTLGDTAVRSGRFDAAEDYLRQGMALFRQLGNREGEANALDTLGTLQVRLGRPAQATEHFERALAIVRESGDRTTETWVLNGLGEAAQLAGDPETAIVHHTAARAVATELGDRGQLARAHAGLAHATDDPAHFQEALALYTDLGLPEADEIRERLLVLLPDQRESTD